MSDCCASLADIAKECGGGNSPGLKQKVYLACVDEITTIPAPDASSHLISTDLTMRAADAGPPEITAGTFKEFAISRGNSSLGSEPQGEDENVSNLVTMNFFISKQTATKAYILNALHGGEFIFIAPDRNGQLRLIGELDNGCLVRVTEQTNDVNGYNVEVTWEGNYTPYFYTGAIVTE